MELVLCLRKVDEVVSSFEQTFSISLAGLRGGSLTIDGSRFGPLQPAQNNECFGLLENIESPLYFSGFNGKRLSILEKKLKWRAVALASSFRESKQKDFYPIGPFCALGPTENGYMVVENPYVLAKFFPVWLKAKLNGGQITKIIDSRCQPSKVLNFEVN